MRLLKYELSQEQQARSSSEASVLQRDKRQASYQCVVPFNRPQDGFIVYSSAANPTSCGHNYR
jgi:hypothetical protein